MAELGRLRRVVGVRDAVVIGAGSMIGAGVFAAWAPAASAAGNGLVIGLAVAGAVAFANATSSAQLAALYPESGGTYVYARRQLGAKWGRLAGWAFVIGKTASCAAIALTVGAYVWPDHMRLGAVLAIVGVTAVNIGGLTRTVAVTRVLLAISLGSLAVVVAVGWAGDDADLGRLTPLNTSPLGVLQSAGYLFFAFAGYARIATLGEDVRDPERTIPRAIPLALGAVLVVYAVVGLTAIAVVDVDALAATDAPLRLVLGSAPRALTGIVRLGAGVAALGVLLNLIPAVSRTVMAMARNTELPQWFAHVDAARSVPRHAELTVCVIASALASVFDLRDGIALSGVAVLTYYTLTNAAAFTLPHSQRRWPRALSAFGVVGCVSLIAALATAT